MIWMWFILVHPVIILSTGKPIWCRSN